MQIEPWPIDRLRPYPHNPRKISDLAIAKVAASIREFGFRQPIVVDGEGVVIAGHTRLAAASSLGLAEVPVHVAGELTAAQAKAYRLADNRTGDEAEWDNELLRVEMLALVGLDIDLSLTAFDPDEIAGLSSHQGLTDPDEVPEAPAVPVTQPGDLWRLGPHRLMCADATDPRTFAALMDTDIADIILTDPPYCSGGFQEAGRVIGSIGSDAARKAGVTIARDNLTTEGLDALLSTSIRNIPSAGCCYAFCDWRQFQTVRRAIEPLGYQFRALLVWDKEHPGMGGPWRHQYEMIFFGTRRKEPPTGKSGDVLRVRRSGNTLHPTQKPTDLLAQILSNTGGMVVVDPFSGSGSTLIACEQEHKRCRALEISPVYCDVTVERWQNFTGRKAERVARAAAA